MDVLQPHSNGFLEEWKSGCIVDMHLQIRQEGIEAAVDSYMPGEEIQELQTHTNYTTDTTNKPAMSADNPSTYNTT